MTTRTESAPSAPPAAVAGPVAAVRAFGVVIGPSVAAAAWAAASLGITAARLARCRRPPAWAGAGTLALLAYAGWGRRAMRDLGATPEERVMPLPGDELVPGPAMQNTRAVTVDAPPPEVWPWLAQIGQDRGGFYSLTWAENLAGCRMRNADRVHPGWGHRAVGETVLLHPARGLEVGRFDPPEVLALRGWGAFVLRPAPGGRTRLLARSRVPRGPGVVPYVLLIEIPHAVMEWAMLRGIRRRAGRAHAAGVHTDAAPREHADEP